MEIDLKCECGQYLRINAINTDDAIKAIDSEGWKLASDSRPFNQRISDKLLAFQNGAIDPMPAYCNMHKPEAGGMKISELIEALWKAKFAHGDIKCMVENGMDSSDFEGVTGLETELYPEGQILKIRSI